MVQLCALVQHGLAIGVIHVLLFYLVEVEEFGSAGQVTSLNRLPKRLMQSSTVLFKCRCIFIDYFCFLTFFTLSLHFLERGVESIGAHGARKWVIIEHVFEMLMSRVIDLMLHHDGIRVHLIGYFLASARSHCLFLEELKLIKIFVSSKLH